MSYYLPEKALQIVNALKGIRKALILEIEFSSEGVKGLSLL